MSRTDSAIEERGEPFLIFTRRGTKERPSELCIQETPDAPLVIYRLADKKGLLLGVGIINNAALGLP